MVQVNSQGTADRSLLLAVQLVWVWVYKVWRLGREQAAELLQQKVKGTVNYQNHLFCGLLRISV